MSKQCILSMGLKPKGVSFEKEKPLKKLKKQKQFLKQYDFDKRF